MIRDLLENAIVLTGSIATGKSTVSNILKSNDFTIIDADKIAHELLDKNSDKIISLFGKEYVKEKKVLRKKLGKIIFSDENEKLKLEALLHPLIKQQIFKEAKGLERQKRPYFIDLPLFFEKMRYNVSKVVVVYAPQKLQVQRLSKRDNIDEKEALLKISNQMDIEEKKALADFVIDNSKDEKHLKNEVNKLLESLK